MKTPQAPGKSPVNVILPMEAKSVASLPEGGEWRYEPKWDGFRCLAFKHEGDIYLQSKSGKPLGRYFPDIVAVLTELKAPQFILDGELLVETEIGYSFSELQMRLHPAESRVRKLAAEHPATYMLFDMLQDQEGKDLMPLAFADRRQALSVFQLSYAADAQHLLLSPEASSLKEGAQWIDAMAGRIDGLIAKNIEDVYAPGERLMQKYKFLRSADCVVGGFRYETDSELVGSLLLGLYDESGLLNHVGFTSGISDSEKQELTSKLKPLIQQPGFTGKAPGGPSRWSTERTGEWEPLKPELVVEVSFDHVTDSRFRHGTRLLRWRPDKAPAQCTMIQLLQPRLLPQSLHLKTI